MIPLSDADRAGGEGYLLLYPPNKVIQPFVVGLCTFNEWLNASMDNGYEQEFLDQLPEWFSVD